MVNVAVARAAAMMAVVSAVVRVGEGGGGDGGGEGEGGEGGGGEGGGGEGGSPSTR